MRIRVEGLGDLLADLNALEDEANRDFALAQGAEVVVDEARSRAPRDTGALAASIYVATKSENNYRAAVTAARSLDSEFETVPRTVAYKGNAVIASAAIYAARIEWTVKHFLRPALDESQREMLDAMESGLKKRVKGLE